MPFEEIFKEVLLRECNIDGTAFEEGAIDWAAEQVMDEIITRLVTKHADLKPHFRFLLNKSRG